MTSREIVCAISLVLAGCTEIGPCDGEAAREIVYDEDGVPAYAGQAIVIQSCGAGGYCHADAIAPELRYGAPVGLDFDVTLASVSNDLASDEVDRLDRNQLALVHTRSVAWYTVSSGEMPPHGIGTDLIRAGVRYDRMRDGSFEELPRLRVDDSGRIEEAGGIVRNWLACRAPLVERTEPRIDMDPTTIGVVVPAIERRCADATWPSLFASVFAGRLDPTTGEVRGGRCAFSGCHGSGLRAAGPTFVPEHPASASPSSAEWLAAINDVARRFIDARSLSLLCGAQTIPFIAPGAPDDSLLYRKLDATSDPPCGAHMPLTGDPLIEQRMCALREWIVCGACIDGTDCDVSACQRAARERCGVTDACVVDGIPEEP